MFKPLTLFIGLRYTRAKRRNHFISFISMTSMLGIFLGVTALITVLSVMNGFEKEVRDRILSMASHATIASYGEDLEDWSQVADLAYEHPNVTGVAPFIKGEAMLSYGQTVKGAFVRGIQPDIEPRVSEVGDKMLIGQLDALLPGEYGIILGKGLARMLGVLEGDKVTLIISKANISPAGIIPRFKRFTVVGVFEVDMHEYDSGLALIHIEDAAKLYQMEAGVSGVRLKLDDIFVAPRVVRELVTDLSGSFLITDWTRDHANFFRALKIEKTMMFVILSLIVAVAAFNIVSTLVMVVTDKQADIAILRTLGATPSHIMAIFMVQGSVIGIVGTLLGALGGITLALNVDTIIAGIEQLFNIKFLAPDLYYITDLPSDLKWDDVLKITTVSFVLSFFATFYPAWRASRTQPAEVLRHE